MLFIYNQDIHPWTFEGSLWTKKTLATSYIYTIFKQNNIYDLFFYPKSIAPSMFIKNMYNFFLQSHTMGSSKKHIFVEMCL